MKYFTLQLSFALLLVATSACGAVRPVIQSADSTRVEVRYETRTVHDTTFVELPVIIEKIQTLDTTSTLENDYARSEAAVSAGVLSHSLETKTTKLPVPVEKEIVYRDSIVFRDRVAKETVEVEKQLTVWQQFKMRVGAAAMIMTVIYGLYLLVRLYQKKK